MKSKLQLIEEKFELREEVVYSKYKNRPLKGGLCSNGYPTTSIDGIPCRIHQIVFALYYGYIPDYVDHKDRDKTNNAPSNLRDATNTENCRNTGLRKHSTTGVQGVGRNKGGTFYAYVNTPSGRVRKPARLTIEQAAEDRKELETTHYGLHTVR